MEEAIADLHNAIHLALSLSPQDFNGGDDLVVLPAESSSTTESRISSLSGSMIEQSQRSSSALNRLKSSFHNNSGGGDLNGGNNGNESDPSSTWQRHCLGTAKNVEHALSNYELALSRIHNGGRGEPIYFIGNEDGSDQASIVDLLVAALTSVTRHLMQQCGKHYLNGMMGSTASNTKFVTSMEQCCFAAACVSANMLLKWFCRSDNFTHDIPLLEMRHVDEMIEEVAVASEDDLLSQFVEPIVTVVNSTLERKRIASSIYDDGGGSIFSNLSAKEGLLLATSLMQRFICQPQESSDIEASSHISLFISSLLEHFRLVLADVGRGELEFREWANAYNEYERNLSDNEMANIPALISQYHVVGIESALLLLESAENLIESSGKSGNVDSIVSTVQDTIRSSMIAISTTETMETLGMMQNPQIRVIFDPLVASFTKFILSGLQKALVFLRRFNCSHDIEGICIIADDLLFRLCCTANGLEFFKFGGSVEGEDILAAVLLRAMSAGCIHSKAQALLDLAAESARNASQDDRPSPVRVSSKRPKFNSSLSVSCGGGNLSSLGTSGSMIDVLLSCLSFSQQGHVTAEELSCITSALMISDGSTGEEAFEESNLTVVDPLNPWHSLQLKKLKPLIKLIEDENASSSKSIESTPMMEPLIAYASALRPSADISSSVFK